MDGSVGPVSHQISASLVAKQTTQPLETTKPREQSSPQNARTEERTGEKPEQLALQAVETANVIADFLDKKISFAYDKRINRVVVKVIRESTEEVIRQIPPEEMIKLMIRMQDDFSGLILDHTS